MQCTSAQESLLPSEIGLCATQEGELPERASETEATSFLNPVPSISLAGDASGIGGDVRCEPLRALLPEARTDQVIDQSHSAPWVLGTTLTGLTQRSRSVLINAKARHQLKAGETATRPFGTEAGNGDAPHGKVPLARMASKRPPGRG